MASRRRDRPSNCVRLRFSCAGRALLKRRCNASNLPRACSTWLSGLSKRKLRWALYKSVRADSMRSWIKSFKRRDMLSIASRKSLMSGVSISAAADGVGARTSAAKSASVKSISWPTPVMMGISDVAIARATRSSLKHHKSSKLPPPRATKITSTRSSSGKTFSRAMAAMICDAASAPCTNVGDKITSSNGYRRRSTLRIS